MAGYLGVTAPAVNKWEHGNSFPDISLLAPIARLLEISTDTLLSYREDLTEQEIFRIVEMMSRKVKEEGYDAAFQYAEENVREYPNCIPLIFQTAQTLNGYRIIYGIEDQEKYRDKILAYYVRCLESDDCEIVQAAAVSLFHYFVSEKEYDKAEKYLERIPKQGFDPIQLQANLYLNQGKTEEAYPLYERVLFASFQKMSGALNGIASLAMLEKDHTKAGNIAEKQRRLAELLEMGDYQEAAPVLSLAIYKQDKEAVLENLNVIIESMKKTAAYRKSELYSHIKFSDTGTQEIAFMLQRGLENDENIEFIRQDIRYKELLEKLKKISKR